MQARRFWILAVVAMVCAGPAWAQERTQATYGDWTLRCEAEPSRNCEVAATLSNAERRPLAQLVVGRLNNQGAVLAMAHVPLNVHLPGQVRLVLEGANLALSFQRCLPAGCFAMVELDAPTMQRLRAEPAQARMVFLDAARQEVSLPMPMAGFARAQTALSAQR